VNTIHIQSRHASYPVHIGENLLDQIHTFIDAEKSYVLIHDSGIPQVYVQKILNALPQCLEIVFPQGENAKCMAQWDKICANMLEANVLKDATIIALGGGVTGDLAGFVAATYMRGIDIVQIPTSLLAQIDSSVGGKVGINHHNTKNAIGAIYPPKMVIVDVNTLKTLPPRHLANGVAEMIKCGMIADQELIEQLEGGLFDRQPLALIRRTIEIKKHFVEIDEYDRNERQLLNFGHTLGHAIEAHYRYERYLHGEAVAIGMVHATLDHTIKHRLMDLLRQYNLPTTDHVAIRDLLPYIAKDKKNRDHQARMVLIKVIGSAYLSDCVIDNEIIPINEVKPNEHLG
jgi:3-dehydroquinate synthase